VAQAFQSSAKASDSAQNNPLVTPTKNYDWLSIVRLNRGLKFTFPRGQRLVSFEKYNFESL